MPQPSTRSAESGTHEPFGATVTNTRELMAGIAQSAAKDPVSWTVTFLLAGWDATIDQPLIWEDAINGTRDTMVWGF